VSLIARSGSSLKSSPADFAASLSTNPSFSHNHHALWLTFGRGFVSLVGLTLGLGGGLLGSLTGGQLEGRLTGAVIAGIGVGLGGGAALRLSFAPESARWLGGAPKQTALEGRLREFLRRPLFGALVGGGAFGVTFGLAVGLTFGVAVGLTFALVSAVAFGLATWIVARPIANAEHAAERYASTPASTLRADRRLTLQATDMVGVAAGVTVGVAFGLTVGPAVGLVSGAAFGLAYALAELFSGGLAGRASHAWVVYLLATIRLALTRRGPWRLTASWTTPTGWGCFAPSARPTNSGTRGCATTWPTPTPARLSVAGNRLFSAKSAGGPPL
jgi:hypothetical protein